MVDPNTRAEQPERESSSDADLLPAELRSWMRLLSAAGAVEQQLRSRVKDATGISHDEFLVLCLLADQPGSRLRMTRIAELLGRPKTRLTYQVACLQRAGLITKMSACGDRRGIEVTLTEKARQLLGESSRPLADAVSEAIARTASSLGNSPLRDILPGMPDTDRQDAQPHDPPG
ncbi:MarR family winged helix-turn-helix transcriptional regulator [Streptomyces sp. NPDC059944]|uniref:MarR family winged helix-turn-helix transcriptional regulator n=1 Tax=unclassified Streptomyces TaxID=2593676 RepID=UPI0036600BF9